MHAGKVPGTITFQVSDLSVLHVEMILAMSYRNTEPPHIGYSLGTHVKVCWMGLPVVCPFGSVFLPGGLGNCTLGRSCKIVERGLLLGEHGSPPFEEKGAPQVNIFV